MASMDQISVQGLAALEKALETLPEKMERNIVRSALRAGLKHVLQEAQARVPVKSGALRDSIKLSAKSQNKMQDGLPTAQVRAGNKQAFYAHMVEFGTQGHTIASKSGKPLFVNEGRPVYKVEHPGAAERPFMRPAFDAGNQQAIATFAATVRKRLTKQGIDIPDEGDAA